MKIIIKQEVEVDAKTLHVEAGVRYWEDGTVSGIEDTEGELIPCREGGLWKPVIELETGKILNWKQGVAAKVHYKVCDAGSYFIKDSDNKTVLSIEDDYVPSMLCPKESGWGDYIILDINEAGMIDGWDIDPDLSDWQED